MALPVPAQSPGDRNVLEVLEDNSRYLEEIKATVTSDSTIIEGQYEILEDQLEIDEENQRLAALEADNAELRARNLERKLETGTGPSAIPMSTPSGGSRGDGKSFLETAKDAFKLGLPLALANAFQGGGLIALGEMFGDSLGEFLGDNIGNLLNDLGLDPAFGDLVSDTFKERTKSALVTGGWYKILFGKGARYAVIADLLLGFLGLPSLTEEGTRDEIVNGIANVFGEKVANLFGGTYDTVAQGFNGLATGAMFGRLLGPGGAIVGAMAGFLFDYFGLDRLADPDKQDEVVDQIKDEFGVIIGTLGAGALATRTGRRLLGGAVTAAATGAYGAVRSGLGGGFGAGATGAATVGGTAYDLGSRPTARTTQTGYGARTVGQPGTARGPSFFQRARGMFGSASTALRAPATMSAGTGAAVLGAGALGYSFGSALEEQFGLSDRLLGFLPDPRQRAREQQQAEFEAAVAQGLQEAAADTTATATPSSTVINSPSVTDSVTIRATNVTIDSPNSLRIQPQVNDNQITETSLQLGRQSSSINLVQPVNNNITNVTNNNTSVAGGGSGSANVPADRSYNSDRSFNTLQHAAIA